MPSAPAAAAAPPKHVPYEIHPERNRAEYYENHWKRVALALTLKHVPAPRGLTLLDYGCGRGESLEIFGAAGFTPNGTDVDPRCVELGARFGRTVVLRPEDPVGQFGRKSFDVVTCFHVLEHVDNPRKTLGELAQIARRHVVVAVPNLRNLCLIGKRDVDLRYVNEGHLQSWDHWHFLNLAQRYCGLELVEWGFDATMLAGASNLTAKIFGQRAAIKLETGLFRRLFPFHGISVLGLFRPR